MFRHAVTTVSVVLGLALAATGCRSLERGRSTASVAVPAMTETLEVDGQTVTAMKLLQTNGKPYAFVFRTSGGLVVCPHFDLGGLEQGGVPAARAYNWKKHGFRQQLEERIADVNDSAAAKGIRAGMTVRQALARLAAPTAPDRSQSESQSGAWPANGCRCRQLQESK